MTQDEGVAAAAAVNGAQADVDTDAVFRMLQDDLASGALGIELLEVGRGTATVALTVTDTMVNGHAIGHGGYVFLLADTAFAYACNSYGPETVAASADITFIAPVYAGDRLTAVGIERAKWGRSGIYDVTVRNEGRVVAEFRGNSRTIGHQPQRKGSERT